MVKCVKNTYSLSNYRCFFLVYDEKLHESAHSGHFTQLYQFEKSEKFI